MKSHLPMVLVAACAAAGADARELEQVPAAVSQHYRDQLEFARSTAEGLQLAVNLLGIAADAVVEARGVTEIAASAERGRQVEVFILRRYQGGADRASDRIVEVSPHPFPDFLSAPGTSYRVEHKRVTGTAAYLELGLPPYPGLPDPIPAEGAIGPASNHLQESRRRAEWAVYRQTVDLWKENYQAALPRIEAELRDSEGRASLVEAPGKETIVDIRAQIVELERQIGEIERRVDDQIATFSRPTRDPGLLSFKAEQQALKARLPALRAAMEIVGSIGGTQPLAGDDARFYRVLQSLSQQLKIRSLAYQQEIARQREAVRLRQQEEERRARAIRRAGWDYLAGLVGAACTDPERATMLDKAGRIPGLELWHVDFTIFFAHDSTARQDLIGLVRGESSPKLNVCQRAVLSDLLHRRQTTSLTEVIGFAADWRHSHPTLGTRIARAFEAMFEALDRLLMARIESERSVGYSWGNERSATGGGSGRESSESRGIRTHGPTIDLRRPDFGPGSTLDQ